MALIENTLFGKINKVDIAIQRIQLANLSTEPLYVCYSGGKDSKVIRRLCEMSGVPFELYYNLTSVDHPDVVREIMDDKEVIVEKPRDKDGKHITMWELIVKNKMPPTGIVRYCCQELKESGGKGRICVTGVRKAESANRKRDGGEVKIFGKSAKKVAESIGATYGEPRGGAIVLNLDNDESRRVIEQCYRTRKTLINPIIDWTDEDVWEFSRVENIKQSHLYIENGGTYRRLGCIMCPLASCKEREKEARDYPKFKAAYIRAFDKMILGGTKHEHKWKSGEEVYNWWLYGITKKTDEPSLFDLDDIAEF